MDLDKLKRLRERYQDAPGSKIYHERFQEVAQSLYSGGKRSKPYAGLPTILDAPYCETIEGLDVALIGVPLDLGVTNRSGARFGPRAARAIERIGPYHFELDVLPFDVLNVADIGDVPFRSRYSLDQSVEDIEAFFKEVLSKGAKTLAIGGDHSVTHPILRAIGEEEPVGMVHIDAHFDTAGELEGEKFQHGGPFRNAVLDGVLDPDRSIQIGIRGSASFVGEFSYEAGMSVVLMEDFQKMGVEGVIKQAREVVGDKPFYVTIDVDGIDPAFTPGTGTPEVGGLTPLETQQLLRGLAGLNVIGGDVVEIAPQYDANTTTAMVGAQLAFEILTLMACVKR